MFGEDVAHTTFMDRIDEGVQQPDGNAFDAFALQHRHQRAHGGNIKRQQHVSFVVEPFGDGQAQMTRNQRLGQHDIEVVLVVAALVAHRDHVAKALSGQQRRAGALALDNGVRGECGAVDDDADVGGGDTGGLQDVADTGHHALLGSSRRRQDLDREAPAVMLERKIGERAADIDGQPSGRHQVLGSIDEGGSEPVRPGRGKRTLLRVLGARELSALRSA